MINNLFLSVGAMKAGTTWLYAQLKKHPDIYFTPEKEIHYFANKVGIEDQLTHYSRLRKLKAVIDGRSSGNIVELRDGISELDWYVDYAKSVNINNQWYKRLFHGSGDRKYCADFSNLYCQMGANGWRNVYAVAENVKVIYTLRDPLARLWSHYKFHMKWVGREDDAPKQSFDDFKALLNEPWFWANAEYARNYELIRSSVDSDDLLVLYFEDFRADPVAGLVGVQEFLGIDKVSLNEVDLDERVNKTKDFELPVEWRNYMLERLAPVCEDMKKLGLWHPGWLSI